MDEVSSLRWTAGRDQGYRCGPMGCVTVILDLGARAIVDRIKDQGSMIKAEVKKMKASRMKASRWLVAVALLSGCAQDQTPAPPAGGASATPNPAPVAPASANPATTPMVPTPKVSSGAGVAATQQWIIGPNAGMSGTNAHAILEEAPLEPARTVVAVHATNGEGLDEHDFTTDAPIGL